MRTKTLKTIIATGAIIFATSAFAVTDYSKYSLQELAQMRGTMMQKSQEERDAFRAAWQEKMRNATPEERQTYMRGRGRGNCNGSGMQSGSYSTNSTRRGQGYGRGYGRGRGQGQRSW